MLSLHGFQPSLSSFMGMDWPVRSLWPEITSLYRHGEELKELKSSLEQLEKLQQKIFEEIQQIPPSQEIYPVACSGDLLHGWWKALHTGTSKSAI